MPTDPADIVAQVLLGEAANQGPEGLTMVADTMFNRAKAGKKTLEQVATAPAQFSAASRPDLAKFYATQPPALQDLATLLVQERRHPEFTPKYTTQHYVTADLWDKRGTLPAKHWLHRMEKIGAVGDHVLLQETPRK